MSLCINVLKIMIVLARRDSLSLSFSLSDTATSRIPDLIVIVNNHDNDDDDDDNNNMNERTLQPLVTAARSPLHTHGFH